MLHKYSQFMKRFSTMWLTGLGIMSAIMVSCSPSGISQVSALILENGDAAGFVMQYDSPIAKETVSTEKYSVQGETIAKIFVSNVNPFSGDKKDEGVTPEGGRYVVALLKENAESENPLSIQQIESIKTINGKSIKAWKKPVKASIGFQIKGGRIR